MKFNPEEISLCKQVMEKHMKPISQGDWYYSKDLDAISFYYRINPEKKPTRHIIPLWIISDCLEFLGDKFQKLRVCSDSKFEIEFWLSSGCYYVYGKTPLEACLKAVLAVLEDKK